MEKQKAAHLAELALKARERAYAPYSGYTVGAALLAKDGRIFTGCNVENASYPAGICAERNAVFHAVSEGCTSFEAIAVAGGKMHKTPGNYTMPCGICRQVLSEFCGPEFPVIVVSGDGDIREHKLGELLPYAFLSDQLR